jgi:hypothetical protein
MQLTWGTFSQTNGAYRQLLRQPAGQLILADLATFCKANAASMVPGDTHMTAFNEGKRAVWNRIQAVLHLTDDELFAIMKGVTLPPKED